MKRNIRKSVLKYGSILFLVRYFEELTNENIIQLLNKKDIIGMRENSQRIDYTAPRGINSVVNYFFDKAGDLNFLANFNCLDES